MTLSEEFMRKGSVEAFASSRIAADDVSKVFPGVKVNLPKTTLTPTLTKKKTPSRTRATSRG